MRSVSALLRGRPEHGSRGPCPPTMAGRPKLSIPWRHKVPRANTRRRPANRRRDRSQKTRASWCAGRSRLRENDAATRKEYSKDGRLRRPHRLIGNFRLEPGNHSAAERPEKRKAPPKRSPSGGLRNPPGIGPLQYFQGQTAIENSSELDGSRVALKGVDCNGHPKPPRCRECTVRRINNEPLQPRNTEPFR